MITGILRKTLAETWILHLLFGLALFVVALLLTMLLPQLEAGINQFLATLPIIRTFVRALLGNDFGENITAETLRAIVWIHPTVLTLLWAQEIIFCTRLPAGEIDRGTIDVLLSWPVSRRKLFATESLVWLASGIWLCAMLLAGHWLAGILAPTRQTQPPRLALLLVSNLFCVYLAVGGIACLVSAISNVRGRAMGVVFALVLASFLLNFLVQFWPSLAPLKPLGVLNYYRPSEILATGQPAWADMAQLLAIGGLAWLAALEVFARRNICTV